MGNLNAQDPIRNALRDLVRAKVLHGWNGARDHWTIVPVEGKSGQYTASETNDLIGMYWEANGTG